MRHASTIAAIITMAAAVSADALTVGPDAFGYLATDEVTFAWEDATGGTRLLVSDWRFVKLGFSFNFYGQDYTGVYFTENGLMTFGYYETSANNLDLTTNAPPQDKPNIAVLWDDWWFKSTGIETGVYYKQRGEEPNRDFVLQWNLLHHDPGSGLGDVTFQAILHEGTDAITLQYLDTHVGNGLYDYGASATVGIRDTGGQTDGRNLQWSYNQAVISGGTAIRITNIPEPVTLAGLILGIGCLSRYVRRRRRA